MALSDVAVEQAVRLLLAARGDHRRIESFPAECRPATMADGYRIQDGVAAALDVPRAGWKIACTSDEACEILSADGPFPGRVFASVLVDSPAELSAGAFHFRGLEGEFAFRLGADLPPSGAPYSAGDMASAIECLYPAIEIVNSRFIEWTKAGAPSLAADNAVNGALVIGPAVTGWQSTDLAAHGVSLSVNGAVRQTGTGADVLGNPLAALAWLANDRADWIGGLKAGDVVTTGTCTGIVYAEAGDSATADFGDLGAVTVAFTD
ncbi:MAG: hydratase [Alphaproteobacteria bacterium]|nr:hydratase [Alphaproteobacteria bacterium]